MNRRAARVRRVLDGLGFVAPVERGWRERAVCREVDPELFYPVGAGVQVAEQTQRARQVCAGCPVRRVCLADVMASEDPGLRWGVTGGLSAAERAALFAARRDAHVGEVA
jgi:WhiB family redox-sensing transcriptional regulator